MKTLTFNQQCALTEQSLKAGRAVNDVMTAIRHLRTARDLLRRAGVTRTLDRVRLALTSAQGAERNAWRRKRVADERARTMDGTR